MLGRVSYNISNGLTAGVNLSYDQAFETRFSADLKYRFDSNGYGAPSKKKAWQTPEAIIQALTESVRHRDVRVHDKGEVYCKSPSNCYHAVPASYCKSPSNPILAYDHEPAVDHPTPQSPCNHRGFLILQ